MKYLNDKNFKCFLRFLKNEKAFTPFRECIEENIEKTFVYNLNRNLIDDRIIWRETYYGSDYWSNLYAKLKNLNTLLKCKKL